MPAGIEQFDSIAVPLVEAPVNYYTGTFTQPRPGRKTNRLGHNFRGVAEAFSQIRGHGQIRGCDDRSTAIEPS